MFSTTGTGDSDSKGTGEKNSALGTLLARMSCTQPQARAMRIQLALVRNTPPRKLAEGSPTARVQYAPHLALAVETLLEPVPGENREEVVHDQMELECPRSVPQYAVLGENLEDLWGDDDDECEELDCRRSAPKNAANREDSSSTTTTRNWIVDYLLNISRLCRQFHQLFRRLRFQRKRTQQVTIRKGKFRSKELRKKLTTSTGCSTICSTGTSRARTSSWPMPLCCTIFPCGRTSTRGDGLLPPSAGDRLLAPWSVVRGARPMSGALSLCDAGHSQRRVQRGLHGSPR